MSVSEILVRKIRKEDAEALRELDELQKKMVRGPWVLLCALGGSVVKWGVFAVPGPVFGL